MISNSPVYKVVEAVTPLYLMVIFGYIASKRGIINALQGQGVSILVSYFALPMFTLYFTLSSDPYRWNLSFLLADCVSKFILLFCFLFLLKLTNGYDWFITSFSLSSLTNTLVVGVPILNSMYSVYAVDLIIQVAVVQYIIWFPLLLFFFELRKNFIIFSATTIAPQPSENNTISNILTALKTVLVKVVSNPNFYASAVGVCWALISNRWHFKTPNIVEGSILILSKAATGTSMFSMGLFMGQQEHLLACGPKLTVLSFFYKFFVGPLAMFLASIAVGLRGDDLHIAIVQAALPQSLVSFIYAKEYSLHANIFSTSIIFGTIAAVPIMIAYYAILKLFS